MPTIDSVPHTRVLLAATLKSLPNDDAGVPPIVSGHVSLSSVDRQEGVRPSLIEALARKGAAARTEVIADTAGKTAEVTHQFLEVNGTKLHYVQANHSPTAKTIVFLHGYPEFWYGWRNQLVHFANAGYNVIAPDLRGFNESDKPSGKGAYAMKNVAADIIGLIEKAAPGKKVTLVAHDWGGSAAYQLAYDRPDLVEHLVELNAPHPNQLREVKAKPWKHVKESLASLYVMVLALPRVPELIFNKVLGFSRAFDTFVKGNMVHKDKMSDQEKARIIESWKIAGALEAGTDYYRDNLAYFQELPEHPLAVPTTLVFGMKDRFMSPRFADTYEAYQPNAKVIEIQDSGHYVHHDRPDAVNRAIADALRASTDRA